MHALACDRRSDLGSGYVLGDIARLKPRHHDLGDSGGLQCRDLGFADQRALLKHHSILADRMDRNGTFCFARRHGAELHRLPSAVSRRRLVISPMMATAISGGEIAPMGSPIGAWMRASFASETPCPFSRSTRRACVFFDPSAPM